MGGQPAKMCVEHETYFAFRPRLETCERIRIERTENWINADSVSIPQQVGKSGRLAIREDEIDLGVWYSERFDCVLHRGGNFEVMRKTSPSSWQREQVVQVGIESKMRLLHLLCPG